MYCSKCGTENPDDGNLCNNCGNKLNNLEPKIASTIVKNKNQGMIKCSKCNSEITTLRKHLPFWEIILWVILLFIPIIGWILLVIEVAWYFSRKPDRCPICGTKVKLKNGKLVHELDFGEFTEKL